MNRLHNILGYGLLLMGITATVLGCRNMAGRNRTYPQSHGNRTISLDPSSAASVRIIFTDDENIERFMTRRDFGKLSRIASRASYYAPWNDSGIMLKMVAQDYTLVIGRKRSGPDMDEWFTFWKEGGKIKYKDKWYELGAGDADLLARIIEKYR